LYVQWLGFEGLRSRDTLGHVGGVDNVKKIETTEIDGHNETKVRIGHTVTHKCTKLTCWHDITKW